MRRNGNESKRAAQLHVPLMQDQKLKTAAAYPCFTAIGFADRIKHECAAFVFSNKDADCAG